MVKAMTSQLPSLARRNAPSDQASDLVHGYPDVNSAWFGFFHPGVKWIGFRLSEGYPADHDVAADHLDVTMSHEAQHYFAQASNLGALLDLTYRDLRGALSWLWRRTTAVPERYRSGAKVLIPHVPSETATEDILATLSWLNDVMVPVEEILAVFVSQRACRPGLRERNETAYLTTYERHYAGFAELYGLFRDVAETRNDLFARSMVLESLNSPEPKRVLRRILTTARAARFSTDPSEAECEALCSQFAGHGRSGDDDDARAALMRRLDALALRHLHRPYDPAGWRRAVLDGWPRVVRFDDRMGGYWWLSSKDTKSLLRQSTEEWQ